MGLALLAAYTPPGHEVRIANQGFGDNVYRRDVDLVGLTAMTAQAKQAYRIADYYREAGVKVVMGGIHASMLPDEAGEHADAVCVGEGDEVWPRIVGDASNGGLARVYQAETPFPMENIPPVHYRSLTGRRTTFDHTIIQASRGCPFDCEFCAASGLFGDKYRFKPVDNVIEEIRLNRARRLFFVDDNILGSPTYFEELCRKLIPLKTRWVAQASLHALTRRPALLKLAKAAGAVGFFIGLESVNGLSRKISSSSSKLRATGLREISGKIKEVLNRGLMAYISVVYGLDGDDRTVFEKTVNFLKMNNVSIASFCKLTPYPGTRLYHRLKGEERILHEDWSRYTGENVVFTPKLMTPQQLENGSDWAGREFYRRRSIVKRAPSNLPNAFYYMAWNIFTRQANWRNHGPGYVEPMSGSERLAWRRTCLE